MLVQTVPIRHPLTLAAEPLTPSSFAPFGAVLTNPAPEKLPHATPASALPQGVGAVAANQGTAIQYRALAPPLRDLYAQAPSGRSSSPRTTMFVCGARSLVPSKQDGGRFEVKILERHPFTTQTFVPLGGAGSEARYLVIVAPSLAPDAGSAVERQLPVPLGDSALPGRGMPDLSKLRAFVASGSQAVTYGAGTWHAPMAALGTAGTAIDFVVMQFANDVPVEDCQEVALEAETKGETKEDAPRIWVSVPGPPKLSRL
ncbi:ureidoglycolate hydrolase [Hypoxylon rubiginosum]|uniref:Ureidoglycolate hydrolase n=1 Tax=Hypoxylon rubiginosum TaxID=110542 RepID=A0ACB9YPP7_9PEZI|nr:ureidoglycolate hydrolase [Hypoxylon rubiginosum]